MKIELLIAFLAGIAASAVVFLLFSSKDEESQSDQGQKNGSDVKADTNRNLQEIEIRLQRAIQLAIKSELSSEAKSRFLAYITHEIRTCLNIIMGITQVFEEEEKQLTEKQKSFLATINDSSRKLLSVTDEVSEFSTRQKTERHSFIKEKNINLTTFCSEIINDQKPVAQSKNLELKLSIANDVPEMISTDKNKLSHLLYTLIENAIRFTSKGTVSLNISKEKELDNDKALIFFQINDSGPGISENKLDSIFDFTDEDLDEAERNGNIKLNLAICKYLAETMGGTISVESKKDSGTSFKVKIPFKISKTTDHKAEAFSPPSKTYNFSGKNALLAEDDPVNRQIEKLLLQKHGFNVDTASNGEEAVKMSQSKSYDIIFMDCEMPVLNGFSACRKIREIEKNSNKHTPIIALTANAMAGDREMCLEAGMDDYIPKPVNIENLVNITSKYLK